MVKRAAVPDAWDDDWNADDTEEGGVRLDQEPQADEPKLTRAQLLAKHEEENRRVWQSADQPEEQPFHLLVKESPPLKTEFKPSLKLLSRKPAGVAQDGENEGDLAKNKLTAEEVRAKTQREREEKQRKYEEVRARLFGTDTQSGSSSPGNTTPTSESGRNHSGRSRGRGRGGNGRGQQQQHQQQQQVTAAQFPQYQQHYQATEEIRRPNSGQSGPRALFDPNHTSRPDHLSMAKGYDGSSSGRNTPKAIMDGEIIRGPKGPDGSGRGGFGIGQRGRGFNG